MPHIFISYAKKDTRTLATNLFATIEGLESFTAWMDESLESGESWALQIQEEIDRADLVLVLLSPDVNRKPSAQQRRSFVLNEIDYAQQEHKPILPIMAVPTKMPVQIAGLEYIDFARDENAGIRRLLNRLQKLSPKAASPEPLPKSALNASPLSNPAPSPKFDLPRIVVFLGLPVLVFVGFIFLPPLFNMGLEGTNVANNPTSTDEILITEEFTESPTDEPTATDTPTDEPTITPSPEPTLSEYDAAIQSAVNFDGLVNNDWTPYIYSGFADEVPMALVPAGCFNAGHTEEQIQQLVSVGFDSDYIQTRTELICVDAFWLDQTEVTQADFVRLGGEKAIPNGFIGDNLPVETIAWFEAYDYCQRLGKRLPTEEEWEYAVRGVESLNFPWGNEFDGTRLNYCDENCTASWRDTAFNDGYETTAPVGTYPTGASWIGAWEMLGNVEEWLGSSRFSLIEAEERRDTGAAGLMTGSSWESSTRLMSAYWGSSTLSNNMRNAWGFRCVRDLEN